ncbi:MAG: hypothetical protein KC419_20080 [Anaerolineales bacterium]|nr:hypothetical protein [Anaerolineales bacterium]
MRNRAIYTSEIRRTAMNSSQSIAPIIAVLSQQKTAVAIPVTAVFDVLLLVSTSTWHALCDPVCS